MTWVGSGLRPCATTRLRRPYEYRPSQADLHTDVEMKRARDEPGSSGDAEEAEVGSRGMVGAEASAPIIQLQQGGTLGREQAEGG